MLDRRGTEPVADCLQDPGAGIAIVAADAYLDQFVRLQAEIDLPEHGRAQPGVAHKHHGLEGMRPSLEGTAFGSGQLQGQGTLLKRTF